MRAGLRISIIIAFIVAGNIMANGQKNKFDLAQLYKENKLTVYNRDITVETGDNSLAMSQDLGEGLVWINGVSFSTGTIEIDLKGQDLFQHSFVGIAFHAQDDSTFEAIYFRPFQFRSTDPVKQARAVQYISLPVYTWQKLREEKAGLYENTVKPVPDPDNWFHVKMIVKEKEVLVYVNDATTPSLQVPLLGERNNGRIALYTADQSGGTFANLVIQNQ
ncbi:MAG TPA: hypothetical protein VK483_14800 [Chitinophagaceae bacterium]|nr:hypothetical protein [Chitinophagaceae bacterium]